MMPLDNDTYDVKMPSLEGKAWAGANGDWVVYIGSNCEWELVNVYTRDRVPLPKISADYPEVKLIVHKKFHPMSRCHVVEDHIDPCDVDTPASTTGTY